MFKQLILENAGRYILGDIEYKGNIIPKQSITGLIKAQLSNPRSEIVMRPAYSSKYGLSYRIISNGIDMGLNINKYEVVSVNAGIFQNNLLQSGNLIKELINEKLLGTVEDIGLNKEILGVVNKFEKAKKQPVQQPVQQPKQPVQQPKQPQPKQPVQPVAQKIDTSSEQEEIRRLRAEKEELQENCNKLKMEAIESKNKILDYEKEKENLKNEIDECFKKKQSLENEISSYKIEKEKLEDEIQLLKRELEDLKAKKEAALEQPVKVQQVVEQPVVEKPVTEEVRQVPISEIENTMDMTWTTQETEPVTKMEDIKETTEQLDTPLITHTVYEDITTEDAPKVAIYLYGKLPEDTTGQNVSITGTTKEFAQQQYEKGESLVVPYVELSEDNEESRFSIIQIIKRLINEPDSVLYDKKVKDIYDLLNSVINKYGDNIDIGKLIKVMNRKFGTRTPDMLYNIMRLNVMRAPNELYNGVPYLVFLINTTYQMSSESTDERQKATKAFDAVACYINAITNVVDDDSNDDDDVWDQLDDDFDGDSDSTETDLSPLDVAVNQVLMAEEMLTKYLEEQMYTLSYGDVRVILYARFQVAFITSEKGQEITVMTNPVLEKVGIKGLRMTIVNNDLKIKDTMGNNIIPIIMSMAIYKNRIRRDDEPSTYNNELQRIWRFDKESVNDSKYPPNMFSSKISGLNEASLVNEKKLELAITHVVYTKHPVQHIFGWGLTDQSPTVLAREKLYFIPNKSDNFKLDSVNILGLTTGDIVQGNVTFKYGISPEKSRELLLSKKLVPVQVVLDPNQMSKMEGQDFVNILSTNTSLRLCRLLPAHKETDLENIKESLQFLVQKAGN